MSAQRSIDVQLTNAELFQGAIVGVFRHIQAISKGLRDKHGFDGETGWHVHIEGALGELALAKALGVYGGLTAATFHAPDIGDLYVRTRTLDHWDLLVRPNDPSDAIFALVVGSSGKYRVVGYISGRDAKRQEWFKTLTPGRPAAYFVPQDALTPFGEAPINAYSDPITQFGF